MPHGLGYVSLNRIVMYVTFFGRVRESKLTFFRFGRCDVRHVLKGHLARNYVIYVTNEQSNLIFGDVRHNTQDSCHNYGTPFVKSILSAYFQIEAVSIP